MPQPRIYARITPKLLPTLAGFPEALLCQICGHFTVTCASEHKIKDAKPMNSYDLLKVHTIRRVFHDFPAPFCKGHPLRKVRPNIWRPIVSRAFREDITSPQNICHGIVGWREDTNISPFCKFASTFRIPARWLVWVSLNCLDITMQAITVAAVYDRRFLKCLVIYMFVASYHKTGGHRPPLQRASHPSFKRPGN